MSKYPLGIGTVAALAIVACIVILLLKEAKPELAPMVSVAFGVAVLLWLVTPIKDVITTLISIANKTGISNELIDPMLKVAGIALVAEFAASVCNDCGQGSLASRVETAGKVVILSISIPIIMGLLDTVLSVVP
ncbi:MAG: stage III sporulation protein AD [Clostridia bacterium]|nr:stage III sporulation protein AD [Clostridia bacterium]